MGARASLMRGTALVAMPWKNGGGVTREIAAEPPGASLDTFAWRVSVADVASAGPFSRFAGIDRTLVLLEGAGMVLDESDGTRHVLDRALSLAQFAGESAIDARLPGGAIRDFNVMVRRGVTSARVAIWRGAREGAFEARLMLLYCASGRNDVRLDDCVHALEAGDTLRIDAALGHRYTVAGDGALIAVHLTSAAHD